MPHLIERAYSYLTDKSKWTYSKEDSKNTFAMLGLVSSIQNMSYIGTFITSTEKPEDSEGRKILGEGIIEYLEKTETQGVQERGRYEETLAHAAARLDLPELTKYLMSNCAEVAESTDQFGQYPWHTAAIFGSVGVLEEHQSAGHVIDSVCESSQWTILHLATLKNHPQFIRYILDNEILPVDQKDYYGRTPLFLAIQYQKREAAYVLLEYGADQTEKTKLRITPMGLSGYFMPELVIPFLDELHKCTILGRDEEKIPTEHFLKFSQSTDLSIILVSPICNDIIVHSLIHKLVDGIYFKNIKGLIGFVIWFLLDILSISFLCMIEQNEITTLLKSEERDWIEIVLVIISVVWIGICASYKIGKFVAFIKLSYTSHQNDISGQLINCSKRCTNERIKQDNSVFNRFHKQLRRKKMDRLYSEACWTVAGTIARTCVICLSLTEGMNNNSKHYIIFVATLAVFFDIFFHDGNDLMIIPNSVMITLLSMKKALSSFVVSLVSILMFSMPYFLITLKFTFKEKHYFTNIPEYERPDGNETETLPAIAWSLSYIFKVMLTDDYQVNYFNDKHPEFFLIYHICIVFLLSLVIMNLIIAQTSQTYEDFVDNSKAEILKHRIFSIILFGMFTSAEDAAEIKHTVIKNNV